MPIRVECPRCGDATHFADNDAGLAVACLACGKHLRVPVATPVTPPISAPPVANEPPPLFDGTTATDAPVPAGPAPAAVKEGRRTAFRRHPVRPAPPRSRWRTFGVLLVGLSCAAVVSVVARNRSTGNGLPVIAAVGTGSVPATSQAAPATAPTTATTTPVSRVNLPTPEAPRTYTPPAAPVGFVGLDRVELSGELVVDSYDAAMAAYRPEAARAGARVVSNGAIRLGDSGLGNLRAALRPGPGQRVRVPPRYEVTGPTEPLAARMAAPPVTLDPFAHDAANDGLPAKFYRRGNLLVPAGQVLALEAGVYYLNDVTVERTATLRIEGPVTLLVSGALNVNGSIDVPTKRPADCRIRLTGDRPVTIGYRNDLFVDLYAPRSTVDVSGAGEVYGSIVARTLRVSGRRGLHFDESLGVGR